MSIDADPKFAWPSSTTDSTTAPTSISSQSRPTSVLFSTFVSLAGTLPPLETSNGSGDEHDQILAHLLLKDIGVLGQNLTPLGQGTFFRASVLSDPDSPDGLAQYVFKHTIPAARQARNAEDLFRSRVRAMMLELRALAHPPIRRHENIVKLMGIAWETDQFDVARKWPVLVIERATRGTLARLLVKEALPSAGVRANLMLDTASGLEVLHACGIIHGDIKLENVLAFDNPDPREAHSRPFIAKLADFGGALFDVSASSVLPSGTRPWNAPEWRQQLDADGLPLTDVYSLGFTLWRILAVGKNPFLLDRSNAASQASLLDYAETLKGNDAAMQGHFGQISRFDTEAESQLAEMIITSTVRRNPADRSLEETKKHLEKFIGHSRPAPNFGGLGRHQHKLRDTFLPYSFQSMSRNMSPPVASFIADELARLAIAAPNHSPSLAPTDALGEAKYGLAELTLNRIATPRDELGDGSNNSGKPAETACLRWLVESAEEGCERAQATFFRYCQALKPELLVDHGPQLSTWVPAAAAKGYFQPLEDMRLLGIPEASVDEALRTLRFRYGGAGMQRFALPESSSGSWATSAEGINQYDRNWVNQLRTAPAATIRAALLSRAGDKVLHMAASCGLLKSVTYLINHHHTSSSTGVNCVNVRGETPLLLACRSGHYFSAMELLEAGADPSLANDQGETPLHWLMSFDDKYVPEVCQRLVAGLQGKNDVVDGAASEFGYIYCAENKFVAGTPLMRAVARNRLTAVRALLDAGADPLAMVRGDSAMYLAARLHYPDALDVLLRRVPRQSLGRASDEGSIVRSLLFWSIRGGSLDGSGTPFSRIKRHGAAWRDRARRTLEILVRLCCSEDKGDTEEDSWPRALALAVAAQGAEEDIVEFLLGHGCMDKINEPAQVLMEPAAPCTPLNVSIASRNLPVFCLLVRNGADTHALTPEGHTMLYECARHLHSGTEFASALIEAGVAVNKTPAGYETPFACALRNRCFKLAEFLWDAGADVNIEYSDGGFMSKSANHTLLGNLVAEYNMGSLACLRFLLRPRPGKSTADFVVSRSLGITVLHILAMAPYSLQRDYDVGLILGCILDHFQPTAEQLSAAPYSSPLAGYTALHVAVLVSNAAVAYGLLDALRGYLSVAVQMLHADPLRRIHSWEAELDLHQLLHPDEPRAARVSMTSALAQPPSPGKQVTMILTDNVETPLHRAAARGNLIRVIELLEIGWSEKQRDKATGCTPSELAERNGHLHLQEVFARADDIQRMGRKYALKDVLLEPMIHLEEQRGLCLFQKELCRLPDATGISHPRRQHPGDDKTGSSINDATESDIQGPPKQILDILKQDDKFGRTILHKAAQSGDVALLRSLLDHDRDASKRAILLADDLGQTPLHHASGVSEVAVNVLLEQLVPDLVKIKQVLMAKDHTTPSECLP
ncbi:hypothetical protein B0H63DRAFT_472415 [Podospora didyma]|uniref:Protein kinase domain-containing protein n=1 Tax=Podospora didyma TaxID=330526 RepID=A0AAE0NP48_9PEZI|nr:hypothetical protein B0H63DRAFT_472415 [Podospora didyma]